MKFTQRDLDLLARSLSVYANWLQTGNPVLSENDARERNLKLRPLSEEGRALSMELSRLRERILTRDPSVSAGYGLQEGE